MKKILFTVLFAQTLICGSLLQAQTKTSYGIKAGANLSTAITSSDHMDISPHVGYNIGVVAQWEYANNLYLQTGIEFTTKGVSKDELLTRPGTTDGNRTWNYHLNYLQIPFTVGYKFALNESTKLLVNAGPYLSYGVYASLDYRIPTYNETTSEFTMEGWKDKGFDQNGFYPFDAGITAGVGVEYNKYLFSINYEGGLFNTKKALSCGNPSWKNQNFTLSATYFFR